MFLAKFRPDLNPRPNFTTQLIDGGQNPQDPSQAGLVANVGIQYTVGLVNGGLVNFISSGSPTIDGLINVANSWLNQQRAPTVVSISYVSNENEINQSSAK
jgi:tripeptidyl-peptidase-1